MWLDRLDEQFISQMRSKDLRRIYLRDLQRRRAFVLLGFWMILMIILIYLTASFFGRPLAGASLLADPKSLLPLLIVLPVYLDLEGKVRLIQVLDLVELQTGNAKVEL